MSSIWVWTPVEGLVAAEIRGLDALHPGSAKVRIVPHQDHVLEVYLRGNLMGALLDGKSLFDERIELRGDPAPA
jgi:hypothetical protein